MWQSALVTGCAGFIGRSLIPILREHVGGGGLYGTSRRERAPESEHLLDAYVPADLSSSDEARGLIESARPEVIFHLASARSGTLTQMLQSNVVATDNLLRCVREAGEGGARVIVVGSSAEIGYCRAEDLPLAEDAPCQPVDDYGVSKLSQSYVAQAAHLSHGQAVIRVRLFNLLGPHLPETLLPGRCVQLLKENRDAGHAIMLSFGNLDTRRDYTDVRDACHAIVLAARLGRSGALYHVGSGKAVSGREVVGALAAEAGLEVECETNQSVGGGVLVPVQVADAGLAARELSWSLGITFEQSARDMWRCAVAGGKSV